MKLSKYGTLLASSLLVLTGCSDENPWAGTQGEGGISPRVIADNTIKDVVAVTRADEQIDAPDVSEFALKLMKTDGTYDRSWSSVGDFPVDETFPMGSYKMEASYGDIDKEGFDCPYFYGSEEFIVEEGETTEVNITASLANSMVSVNYTEAFEQYFKNYGMQFHTVGGDYVDYNRGETRPVYLKPGEVKLIISLQKQNDVSATFQPAAIQIQPRHHYHITVDVNQGEVGDAQLSITFDDSIVEDDVVIDLSDELMLSPEPEMIAKGFTPGESFEVLECTAADAEKKFEMMARAGIGSVFLTTHSDALLAKGMLAEVDLMNLDQSQQELMKSLGFNVVGLWKNPDKMAFVDLAKVFESIEGEGTHEFTLVLKDKITKVTEPIRLVATTKAVNVSLQSATDSKLSHNYTYVTLDYTGVDFAKKVTFDALDAEGNWVKCDVSEVTNNGSSYTARVTIPDGVHDVKIRANYCGAERSNVTAKRIAAKLSFVDYNIWANKAIVDVELPQSFAIEDVIIYLAEGDGEYKLWENLTRNASDNQIVLNGLTPGKKYSIKYYSSMVFNTEAPLQVGNAGFEDWATFDWAFDHNSLWESAGQSSPMKYYKPWASNASDKWWDSNATTSLVSSLTMGYTFFKCFPLVHYSIDAHSGKRSAQITVANIGNTNSTWATTGNWYVGELLIGKGNDGTKGGWKRSSEGHSFGSRPTSLKFWYEYAPYSSSDTFSAEIWLKADDGTIIATASLPNGKSASQWTSVELPLNYKVYNKKAASIYIAFKASASSSHSCDVGGHWLEVAGSTGSGDPYRIKLSATLRVDDIQLNY